MAVISVVRSWIITQIHVANKKYKQKLAREKAAKARARNKRKAKKFFWVKLPNGKLTKAYYE